MTRRMTVRVSSRLPRTIIQSSTELIISSVSTQTSIDTHASRGALPLSAQPEMASCWRVVCWHLLPLASPAQGFSWESAPFVNEWSQVRDRFTATFAVVLTSLGAATPEKHIFVPIPIVIALSIASLNAATPIFKAYSSRMSVLMRQQALTQLLHKGIHGFYAFHNAIKNRQRHTFPPMMFQRQGEFIGCTLKGEVTVTERARQRPLFATRRPQR